MSQRNKQAPSNWDAYERGRAASLDSLDSITEADGQQDAQAASTSPTTSRWMRLTPDRNDGEQGLRNRRSSVFNSIRQMGGINNIDNFARSFQRAQGFRTITPIRRGSISYPADSAEEEAEYDRDMTRRESTGRSLPNRSLLRQQFEAAQSPEMTITDAPTTQGQPEASETTALLPPQSRVRDESFSVRSRLGAEVGPELGTSYGSISSRLTDAAQRRASILIQQHVEASIRARETHEEDEEPKDDVMDRPVDYETREDGEVIERYVGESTVPMTIFNSINVLVGIGVLAIPLAMRYTGWVLGLVVLTLPAFLTNYTAKLLAKCLDTNSGSTTYGDLAFLAFGDVGRAIVETLFIVELLGANVALLILFGDSMHSLIPSVGVLAWKTLLAIVLLPLNFVPFKTLSLTSILGIVCTLGIVSITYIDGFIKPQSPGSLRDVMPTYAFPQDWRLVPLSVGLFVAPWGGHSVFPAVYKDMRHPQKYGKALTWTYIATYGLDASMAVLGYLMFGDVAHDEVSKNILLDPAYPKILSVILVVLVCIIPVTKLPLSNRPIMDTINKKFLLDLRQMDAKARRYSEKSWKHRLGRFAVGVATNIAGLGLSILIPDFDSIMASLGASVCLLICVILPILFYLKIFSSEGKEISKQERIMDWVLIFVAAVIGTIGTVFAVLPKEQIGAKACKGIACMG